jgi:hypothetical protein
MYIAGRAVALAALSLVMPGIATAASERWTGKYVFDLTFESQTAKATRQWAEYRLTLKPDSCLFNARDAHADEVIRCTTAETGDQLDIRFLSYGDGSTVDSRGNAVYQPGDPLFTLIARKGQILTAWKGYPLPDEKPHTLGVYFRPGHPAP